MKKNIFLILSLASICIITISACKKNAIEQSRDQQVDYNQIKKDASKLGKLHNDALWYVGENFNLSVLTDVALKETIYNFSPTGSGFKYFDSKFKFVSKGLSFSAILNKYFKTNTIEMQTFLAKANNAEQNFSNLTVYHSHYDNLIEQVIASNLMPDKEKIALILGFEVARNSGLFWYDAKTSRKNPYNIFFKDVLYPQGICILCGMSCQQAEDFLATVSAYGYYLEGGYSESQAATAATQDGQYHSALAVSPGGACN